MKNEEIERRFLLLAVPAWLSGPCLINQGYLVVDHDGNEVRVRSQARDRSGRYFVTTKYGHGVFRKQYETEIREVNFNDLWPATEGRRLRKERFYESYAGGLIEVDRYLGSLLDLVIAEVEFPDLESSKKFIPPIWFKTEVSDRPEYSNQSLALYGLPACFVTDMIKLAEG